MDVYNGKEPHIFISYAHSDSKIVLPIVEHMQQSGFRVWYDGGIEAGTEWPQYIAEHLASASCIMVFLSPNSANSHNCRNEINLASELKKEMLVVHLKDFDTPLGLKLQLNLSQAIYKSRFKNDSEFLEELEKAAILAPYKGETTEPAINPTNKPSPTKTKKSLKPLFISLGIVALIAALVVTALLIFGKSDDSAKKTDSDSSSVYKKSESIIVNYNDFYERLKETNTRLECDSLWNPSTLIDNRVVDQKEDGDTWVTYYTNSFTLENTSLHIAFRNEGAEIIAILNSFKEEDLGKAYKILESISSAVNGYYFTDFNELLTNDDRLPWQTHEESFSIWNETLELEEPAYLLYDENTEMITQCKLIGDDTLLIQIERRCRVYNGQKYFDFTILYEHPDNMQKN